MWAIVLSLVATAWLGIAFPEPAKADPDSLLPITFKSIQGDLKRALVKQSVKDAVSFMSCLDGGGTKRTVCTYKVGDYLSVMATTEKGGSEIVGITVVCASDNDIKSLKCLLSYGAVMAMASDLPENKRTKILGTLVNGIDVGNAASITTDERKFIMQKSMGIWFHVYAASSADAE